MTAIPFGIMPAHDEATIRNIVERFERFEIHLVETRGLIMPAFGIEWDEREERRLTDYLDAVLDRVRSQEIGSDTAAADIWQLAIAAQAGDGDLHSLQDIGCD